jgi:hypothetical protein
MKCHARSVILCLPLVAALALPALAEERDHDRDRHGGHGEFHDRHPRDFRGRDFHHFDDHERTIWIGGRWHHDWHDGRYGWWWDLGDVWYFYPEPIYPYPTYVTSEAYIEPVPPPPAIMVAPPPPPPPPAPVIVQAPAPPPPPAPAGAPAPQFWYYCDAAQAYYPYVSNCPGPWRQVAAGQNR